MNMLLSRSTRRNGVQRRAPKAARHAFTVEAAAPTTSEGIVARALPHHAILSAPIRTNERMGQDLAEFPHLKRWFETLRERAAVKRGMGIRVEAASAVDMKDPKVRAVLFGQRAK